MRRTSFVVLLVLAWVATACAAPSTSPTAAATDPAAATPTPLGVPIDGRIQATIAVEGSPDWPTAAFGSVWVLAPDLPLHGEGVPNLVRIDPATNAVVATIALSDRLCQGIVATDGAIWACAIDGLVRVDPETNAVAGSVPVALSGRFYRPAFGAGRVWVLGDGSFAADTVIGLDPQTGSTTSHPVGGPVGGITFGFDAVWVTLVGSGSVVRLDPVTGETRVLVTGLPAPAAIVAGETDLWVALYGDASEDGTPARAGEPQLARINPVSGEIAAQIAIGEGPKGGLDPWPDGSTVLVRGTRPWLARVDATTNAIVEAIASEPTVEPINGPLTVAFGSIWTVNVERPAVYRIAP